jgi:hypothetical protein
MGPDFHHFPGEDVVFLAGDVLVKESTPVAIEDGFGDIAHPLAIDQGYVVAASAPRQEGGAKEQRQKSGPLAMTEALDETGVCLGQISFNAHNRLCCVSPMLAKFVLLADKAFPSMSTVF